MIIVKMVTQWLAVLVAMMGWWTDNGDVRDKVTVDSKDDGQWITHDSNNYDVLMIMKIADCCQLLLWNLLSLVSQSKVTG